MTENRNISEQFRREARRENEGACVNYVWISGPDAGKDADISLMGVPYHYLNLAMINARRYPHVAFKLWLDSVRSDTNTRSIIKDKCKGGPPNVEICNLRDIPRYAADPIFKPGSEYGVYEQADLARLYVINHCFVRTKFRDVIYADFDIKDLHLKKTELVSALLKHGMMFGATLSDFADNGFMAFRRGEGRRFAKKLTEFTRSTVLLGENGYMPLVMALGMWSMEKPSQNLAEIGFNIMQPSGVRLSYDPNPKEKNEVYSSLLE